MTFLSGPITDSGGRTFTLRVSECFEQVSLTDHSTGGIYRLVDDDGFQQWAYLLSSPLYVTDPFLIDMETLESPRALHCSLLVHYVLAACTGNGFMQEPRIFSMIFERCEA